MEEGKGRVLVIDDDPMLARAIGRVLVPEYDVVVCTSAREALVCIESGRTFDVILCDLSLPMMDGVAFYERLRVRAPELAERVVIMTGGAFTARTGAFLVETQIARLDKPFELEELRRRVRRLAPPRAALR